MNTIAFAALTAMLYFLIPDAAFAENIAFGMAWGAWCFAGAFSAAARDLSE